MHQVKATIPTIGAGGLSSFRDSDVTTMWQSVEVENEFEVKENKVQILYSNTALCISPAPPFITYVPL